MKRELGKADDFFDIPAVDYFIYGNNYTGSCGSKFRYNIVKTEDRIKAEVWNKDVCYALADVTSVNDSFPLTEEGLNACILWLLGEYEKSV